MTKKNIKALVLFSGGLDSILAAEILKRQGVEVLGVAFESYFFSVSKAEESAERINLPLKKVDVSKEHLKIVKSPRYGRGSEMNPCIDCHLLMLKKAKEILEKEGFDFIVTGEVLGERPMSQHKEALKLLSQKSGLKGLLVRPLSAKLLEETIPEKKGWIKRENLFGISGRSRKEQIELAKKFGIKNYPAPSGGCPLCQKEYARKLRWLLEVEPEPTGNDILLLKAGRHFEEGKNKIVVGRNHEDNMKIKRLAREGDVLVELEKIPGPTTLVRFYEEKNKQVIRKAEELTVKYANKAEEEVSFKIERV